MSGDWSADVGSSDLHELHIAAVRPKRRVDLLFEERLDPGPDLRLGRHPR